MSPQPKILIVDDEPVILNAARRTLSAEGFPVVVAEDAESALSVFESEEPEIVVTDLMLPGLSGLALLQAIHKKSPGLPVIITTGYSTVDNAVASVKEGAFDFLPKPFTFDEILSPIRRAEKALRLDDPLQVRSDPAEGEASGWHYLGGLSRARVGEDGVGILAIAEPFLQTTDPIEKIEFPEVGFELRQGGRFVRLVTDSGLRHDVWSPLSGQVLEINEDLREKPGALQERSSGAPWLVRVLPTELTRELGQLTLV